MLCGGGTLPNKPMISAINEMDQVRLPSLFIVFIIIIQNHPVPALPPKDLIRNLSSTGTGSRQRREYTVFRSSTMLRQLLLFLCSLCIRLKVVSSKLSSTTAQKTN